MESDSTTSQSQHAGIDIHAPKGTPVVAANDQTLVYIWDSGGDVYQVEAEGDADDQVNGNIVTYIYAHLRGVTAEFNDIGERVTSGTQFAAVRGSSSFDPHGGTFDHVHFNIETLGQALNPLLHLPNSDPIGSAGYSWPDLGPVFVKSVDTGQYIDWTQQSISGQVDIIAEIRDDQGYQANVGLRELDGRFDGIVSSVYEVSYWIEGPDGAGVGSSSNPRLLVRFDRAKFTSQQVSVIYDIGKKVNVRWDIDPNGLYYNYCFILTHTDNDGTVEAADANEHWDTRQCPNGEYTVHIITRDIAGNNAHGTVTLSVHNEDKTIPTVLGHREQTTPSTNIVVTFSEAMTESTLTTSNIAVLGSVSGSHACALSFDHSTYQLTINPNTDFQYSERVTVTIGTGVKDLGGNALATPYQFAFNIMDEPTQPPTSISVDAQSSNTSIDPYQQITISGSAKYNTGLGVTGTATINAGSGTYTAAVTGGLFSRSVTGPSSSGYITVNVSDGTLSGSDSVYISVTPNGGTPTTISILTLSTTTPIWATATWSTGTRMRFARLMNMCH